jgi:hypothetical protein
MKARFLIEMKHMISFCAKKKRIAFALACAILLIAVLAPLLDGAALTAAFQADGGAQWEAVLQRFFDLRGDAVLRGDAETLASLYFTEERNGRWAYENELARSQYLADWAVKQGVAILNIRSAITLRSVKRVGRGYAFYVVASTLYEYSYPSAPDTGERLPAGHVPLDRPDPVAGGGRMDRQPGVVRRPAFRPL